MIFIQNGPFMHDLKSTRFPDGTSQVWKLPEWLWQSYPAGVRVTWYWEGEEREVIDLLSLFKLLEHNVHVGVLHIPFLPYGRQDKEPENDSTFNLHVLADMLNLTKVGWVTSVDVHNPGACRKLINNFYNVDIHNIHDQVIDKVQPDFLVYPDQGAADRYLHTHGGIDRVILEKERDSDTGVLLNHFVLDVSELEVKLSRLDEQKSPKFLILDDICDGGATFISVASAIREVVADAEIHLFVTHGIFSNFRNYLLTNGIDSILTTNSLLQNKDGYPV